MRVITLGTPAENSTIEWERAGTRIQLTIRQGQTTIDGYRDDDRVTSVSVPIDDLRKIVGMMND